MNWRAVSDAAPHGNIRRAHLRELGVADSTIAARTLSGLWTIGPPGVIRLMGGTATADELVDSALLHGGPDAVVSGAEACRRYGLRCAPDDGTVLVLEPHGTRRRSVAHVVVERTHRLPTPVERDGFPLAPVTRAVLDAARRLRRLDPVRALLAEAVQRGFTTVPRLAAELAAGSGRGSRLPRIALGELGHGVRSAPEAWGRGIALELEDEGFPRIEWNVTLYCPDCGRLCSPDGWVDGVALGWELQSEEWHLSPADQERSYRNNAEMRRHDIEIVEHRPRSLRREREQVKGDLRIAHLRALRRPRPSITARRPDGSVVGEHDAERSA